MHDVAIIGAGPAGLAAGTAARRLGANVLIIEQGKELEARSQSDRIDVISGIGGAGLYSDGKFSFFPAATALWSVRPHSLLAAGYEWLKVMLMAEGMSVPRFPAEVPSSASPACLHRKKYPSFYLPVDKRAKLLASLTLDLADSIYAKCRVCRIEQSCADCVRICTGDGTTIAEARSVVLAMGRLGPLMLHRSLPADELVFRKVEVGARIEQPAEKFILPDDGYLDPKVVGDEGQGLSWRTFCCCRNGLVVFGSSTGLSSVSGRADCPPTGRSNIGLLVRLTDANAGMVAWRDIVRAQPMDEPAVECLHEIINRSGELRGNSRVVRVLGQQTARRLVDGLNGLAGFVGRPLTETSIYAPAIEGVGLYPRIGRDLRIPGRPIFVAGDITGIFRGLTAALVSGFVAGAAAASIGHISRERKL
jgi:uncharacterized protein